MRIWIIVTAIFLCSAVSSASAAVLPDFAAAAAKARQSVVYISVYATADGGKDFVKSSYGSGTIISREGYLITNFHVVNKGELFQVVLEDGTECETEKFKNGSMYLADEETDLAVLKIRHPEKQPFVPFTIADSDTLAEGQWVVAVGNPYGLRHSVSSGIISSLRRSDVGFAEIEDFIQTDVPINPGNSGGPLVNQKGELVGINAAIRTVSGGFQGISFAIPSRLAVHVFNELVHNGRVRRGWLGILVREEKRRTESDSRVIRVISVAKDSPAYQAGIREGDIIRKADGSSVTSQGKLMRMVKNSQIGSTLLFTISRDGKLTECSMVLREKESFKNLSRVLQRLYESYGIELAESSGQGPIVMRLSPSRRDMHGGFLREGDVIVSLNGGRVKSIDDFVRLYSKWDFSISKGSVVREGRVYVIAFKDALNDLP